jgi:superfamily II DNA helicase RecQ
MNILQQLALLSIVLIYYLQYCKQPFSVTSFLQHKLKFAQPKINLSCYASGKKESTPMLPILNYIIRLKRWRDMKVQEENTVIYMVANQATLKEIATYLPLTKKQLLQISGFGKAKVDKYGDDVLEAVEEYCSRNGT